MLKNMRLRVPTFGKVDTITSPDAQCAKKVDINLGVTNASSTFPKNQKIWKLSKEKKNPLSNFFPCELSIFGETFKSAEQAFQTTKALRSGDVDAAERIRNA
jgi:hypothetical protein